MKRGKSEQYALDESQVAALFNEAESFENLLMLKLMAYLGLRVSEIAHLRADWIHEGEIRIPPSQLCDCSNCKGEWHAKSKASVRSLPIPNIIADDLYTFLGHSPTGFNRTRQALWWKVKQIAKRAKSQIKGPSGDTVFPHALRATAATNFATKGMSAVALCYIMGWAELEMGQHYINIAKAKSEAHKQMKEILG